MSSSPRISGTTVILAAVLAWILILSYGLRRLFGAEMTGGWMLIGILFTLGAIGFLIILNEIRQAITIPASFNADRWRSGKAAPEIQWIDWTGLESRRLALGLSSDSQPNRYRTQGKGDSREIPIDDEHVHAEGLLVRAG